MMSAAAKLGVLLLAAACLAEGYYLGGRTARARPPAEGVENPERPRVLTAGAGVRSEVSSTEDEIIVSFQVPGLEAESLKISVGGAWVTISCAAGRRYEMIMPLPAGADAARHRVVQEGEAFRIIFEKFSDPRLKF